MKTANARMSIDTMKSVRRYVLSWFLPDLCMTFCGWLSPWLNRGRSQQSQLLIYFLRAVPLLRYAKISDRIRRITHGLTSESLTLILGIVKSLVGILVIGHYAACTWYAVEKYIKEPSTWPNKFLMEDAAVAYAYVTSLHWSLAQYDEVANLLLLPPS